MVYRESGFALHNQIEEEGSKMNGAKKEGGAWLSTVQVIIASLCLISIGVLLGFAGSAVSGVRHAIREKMSCSNPGPFPVAPHKLWAQK